MLRWRVMKYRTQNQVHIFFVIKCIKASEAISKSTSLILLVWHGFYFIYVIKYPIEGPNIYSVCRNFVSFHFAFGDVFQAMPCFSCRNVFRNRVDLLRRPDDQIQSSHSETSYSIMSKLCDF